MQMPCEKKSLREKNSWSRRLTRAYAYSPIPTASPAPTICRSKPLLCANLVLTQQYRHNRDQLRSRAIYFNCPDLRPGIQTPAVTFLHSWTICAATRNVPDKDRTYEPVTYPLARYFS